MNQAATLKRWKENSMPEEQIQSGACAAAEPAVNPRVMCFSSGKGGVGKTSMVTNIGLAMASLGNRVMILDADLGLANVDVILGLSPRYTIKHLLSGEKALDEILVQGPGGIHILPSGPGVPELVNLSEGEKLTLLSEMEGLESPPDVMLIDTAAGIADNVLYFNIAARQRIVVVTPEPTSITDAYALIKVLSGRHQIRDFMILVNWVKNEQEARKVFKQLAAVADRFLGMLRLLYVGFIPRDPSISRAVRQQRPALELYPDSKACREFINVAENILNTENDCRDDGNIKFFWKQLLGI